MESDLNQTGLQSERSLRRKKFQFEIIVTECLRRAPPAAARTCTCQPPPGRPAAPCPTRPGRRPAAAAPAQPPPSGAAPAPSAVHPPEQRAAPPSPDARWRNGRRRLPAKRTKKKTAPVLSGGKRCLDIRIVLTIWLETGGCSVVFSNQGLSQYKDCPTQESACKKKQNKILP